MCSRLSFDLRIAHTNYLFFPDFSKVSISEHDLESLTEAKFGFCSADLQSPDESTTAQDFFMKILQEGGLIAAGTIIPRQKSRVIPFFRKLSIDESNLYHFRDNSYGLLRDDILRLFQTRSPITAFYNNSQSQPIAISEADDRAYLFNTNRSFIRSAFIEMGVIGSTQRDWYQICADQQSLRPKSGLMHSKWTFCETLPLGEATFISRNDKELTLGRTGDRAITRIFSIREKLFENEFIELFEINRHGQILETLVQQDFGPPRTLAILDKRNPTKIIVRACHTNDVPGRAIRGEIADKSEVIYVPGAGVHVIRGYDKIHVLEDLVSYNVWNVNYVSMEKIIEQVNAFQQRYVWSDYRGGMGSSALGWAS